MSLRLQPPVAALDSGASSGVARPTPSPSGSLAPVSVAAIRSEVQVAEAGGRVQSLRPATPPVRASRADRDDTTAFSRVAQRKLALSQSRNDIEPPSVGLPPPVELATKVDETTGEKAGPSPSELQPFKAVFQTLTAKVQFAKSETGEVIVQIVDSRTQEVVRELPSEALMKLQGRLEQMNQGGEEKGLLFATAG